MKVGCEYGEQVSKKTSNHRTRVISSHGIECHNPSIQKKQIPGTANRDLESFFAYGCIRFVGSLAPALKNGDVARISNEERRNNLIMVRAGSSL